ncbi:MAG: alanine racemase, partial [Rhodospirillaceae bacterium]|nr:alanine racemase [Rhodospirillaceae bacterium]
MVTTSAMSDTMENPDNWPDVADARRAGAILTIDLGAIKNNWQLYNNTVSEKCVAGAVIKAGGYGLDARHVGVALSVGGCKTFFVATIDEGITLRSVLGDEPEIFILGCVIDGNEKDLSHYGLSPVLNSLSDIKTWKKFSPNHPCALHIDTGMNRLGLGAKDVEALTDDKDALSGININLIMSHLACADDASNPMNAKQLGSFKNALKESLKIPLASINKSNVRTSIANSSGVFLGDEYHLDMVRPGAALFGVNPTPEKANPTTNPSANPMAQVIRLQ